MTKRFQFGRRSFIAGMVASLLALVGLNDEAEAILFSGAPVSGPSPPVGGLLTPWTVTNNTASPMTNVPVEVPIQFSPAGGSHPFVSTSCIEVVDADGVTVLPVQEWGRYSDLNGPDLRGIHKLTVILPSLGASQTKQLTINQVLTTSPTTGTDITASEITATGFTLPVSIAYNTGTTYTADAATGLAASTWTNKTTASNKGTWVSGGGFSTSYIVTVPFKNGGTAAPNNLTLWAEVTAYKAQRGAVSVGNPIIGIRCQYWIKSAYAQETGQINHWYDLSATCGTNSQTWNGSAPARNLTLSTWTDPQSGQPAPVNTRNAQSVFTASGTAWTQDSVGQMISDGTGQAVINEYISATVVYARVTTPFASTTVNSGTWRTWGVTQQFSSDIPPQEIWYGGSLAITSKPDIESFLGAAWNGSSGGPFTYLRDCKMILPYTTPYTSITNSLARLSVGTYPTASSIGYIGDWTAYMPQTGGRDDIAPIPGQYVGPLIKWDANGRAKIAGNAVKSAMFPMWYIDENTGKSPQFNSGTDWYLSNDNWTGTRLPQANRYITGTVDEITGAEFQVAHHPGIQTVPILLKGDFYYVEALQQQVFACFAFNNPGYQGYGVNRMFCNASELRGNAWTFRDVSASILFVPDAGNACLSYTRSSLQTILGNQFTATNSGTPDVPQYPGNNIGLVNNTGTGKVYATSGYRAMGQGASTDVSQWQLGYLLFGLSLCKLQGMVTGDFDSFMTWAQEGLVGAAVNSNVNLNWYIPIYYGRTCTDTGTPVNGWADVYRWSSFDLYNGSAKRLITGTGITLSGLSGSGITVTMPAGYFTTGGNNYIGCPVVDINAASVQVAPFTVGTDAFNSRAYRQDVDVVSGNRALPTNSGCIKVWNTSANNVYIKLSIGPSTATASDTLVAPGAGVKFNVGSNTYLNYIATGGYGNITVFGSVGSGYVNTEVITIDLSGVSGAFSITTKAKLTVTDVGPSGDVIAVTVSDPGLYIANTAGSIGTYEDMSQASTTGAGTGFTYKCMQAGQVFGAEGSLRFGVGMVTGVSGNVLTIKTTGSWRGGAINCYPFAQTGLVTNKIQTGGPQVGDSNGPTTGLNDPYLPTPYSGSYDYWQIAKNTAYMMNQFGYSNASTAYTNIATAYTGSSELIWRVT